MRFSWIIKYDTIFGNAGSDLTHILHQLQKPGFLLIKQRDNNAFTSEKPGFFNLLENGTRYKLVWLGAGEATVILETGEGFDTVKNRANASKF
ncbi:hypothetical protein NIES267_03880 [Calothrix parasitica NIES-267]|uniref:Uncharacterized protein n=1 Tax=Calothrix parasitica NIES-267 TaxID=1973488 RepID=A0A1Z4LI66_9CYAN|nr:hypothetical protein NIES267_03880 [Calothrix parasitica NIES-267]